jgi:hypothetical protein
VKIKISGWAAAIVLLVAPISVPANAHHSTASFNYSKNLSLAGTVKDFKWTNPHMYIDVLVANQQGVQEVWSIECGVPNMNVRNGWKKTDINAGDKVSMVFHPMLDTSVKSGTLVSVKLPDGRTLYGPGGDIVPVDPAKAAHP